MGINRLTSVDILADLCRGWGVQSKWKKREEGKEQNKGSALG